MNRRRFLAGSAMLGGASAAALALDVPGTLALKMAKSKGLPEFSPRITVRASHVESARDHLRGVTETAHSAWADADASVLDGTARTQLADGLDAADRTLREVESGSGTLRTLEKFQYAVGRAAETLGTARYLNDRFVTDQVFADADRLSDDAAQLRDGIEYVGTDPSDFLVHVRRVEYSASQARTRLRGLADGGEIPASHESDALGAGTAVSAVETAKRDLEDGRRIYRAYRSGIDGGDSFADALDANRSAVVSEAERLRESREEDALSDLPDGPYAQVRSRIASQGWHYGRGSLGDAKRQREGGYDAYAAVTAAEALQQFRAWRYGLEQLDVSRDAGRVDEFAVADARRTAGRAFRSAHEESRGDPLARRLLEPVRARIETGDDALGWDDQKYPRADAYGWYLLGAGHAEYAVETAEMLSSLPS